MNNLKGPSKSLSQRIKKLAAFGCSFTDWHIIGRNEGQPNKSWPEYLGEYLNCDVFNGGRCQLTNNLIAQNLMMYLAKGNKPDVIIVGLTEWQRITVRDVSKIDNFSLGKIASGRRGEGEWFRCGGDNGVDKRHGASDIYIQFTTKTDKHTLPHQEAGLATMIYIQTLCESYNIPVYFLNFLPLGKAMDSPIASLLKTENMIIENYRNGGWHNHLEWCAFSKVDPTHFGIEAQKYTAEVIEDFLLQGIHPVVEEEIFNTNSQIFDYT